MRARALPVTTKRSHCGEGVPPPLFLHCDLRDIEEWGRFRPLVMNADGVLVDVFTQRPLQGHPLTVFTDARGLSDASMLALAASPGSLGCQVSEGRAPAK